MEADGVANFALNRFDCRRGGDAPWQIGDIGGVIAACLSITIAKRIDRHA